MTDRVTPQPAPAASQPGPVTLASDGKTWGRLLEEGRYLEVARRGVVVVFDLHESTRRGVAVVAWLEGGEG